MDTKSLARSKRAHTQQHNKKYHPNPKSKSLTPTTISSNQNSSTKSPQVVAEKQHRKPSLPSNWDRYDDEFDENVGSNVMKEGMSDDVVLPKSKGADFGYLISEAKEKLDSMDCSKRFASSFDDVLPDFIPGMSSMLSVRGNGMLSWIGNDNFIVDDSSSTSTTESSFLSMDLHSLASQLEKLDPSQRLFLEPDLLPPHNVIKQPESKMGESRASDLTEKCIDDFAFLELSSEKESRVEEKDNFVKIESVVEEVVESKGREKPTFEELTADLDMLLDSSEPLDSSKTLVDTSPISQWGAVTQNTAVLPPSSTKPTVLLDDFDSWLDTI
ncbi:hypothetical protein ACHQM5_003335 [Ranunculus cassubicifolius]